MDNAKYNSLSKVTPNQVNKNSRPSQRLRQRPEEMLVKLLLKWEFREKIAYLARRDEVGDLGREQGASQLP